MGTLLKYEFRRSRVIFLGIAAVTIFFEALYLIGWFFEWTIPFSIGILGGVFCILFSTMAILLYGVILFNDDISKKPGYLLFSTPRSAAQIVCTKLLMTLLALIGLFFVFFVLIGLDIWLVLARNGTSILAMLQEIDVSITEAGIKEVLFNGYNLFGLCMYILESIFSFVFEVIVAYTMIVLTKTIMGNQKGRTILAILFWIIISSAVSNISAFISAALEPEIESYSVYTTETMGIYLHAVFHPAMYLPGMILTILCGIGGFALTTWLIDKKLSL